jgi:hypothetical protein
MCSGFSLSFSCGNGILLREKNDPVFIERDGNLLKRSLTLYDIFCCVPESILALLSLSFISIEFKYFFPHLYILSLNLFV